MLSIHVAPLRERKQDIAPLVEYYARALSVQLALPALPFNHEDIQQLETYDWPGNIRELKNFVERCLLLGRLPEEMMTSDRANSKEQLGYPDTWSLDQVENEHILKVVNSMGGNKNQAAKLLGVSSKTLYRKLKSEPAPSDD